MTENSRIVGDSLKAVHQTEAESTPATRSPLATFLGAVTFYTCLPIPVTWRLEFHGIARWASLVGMGIGAVLAGVDLGLHLLGMPILTRSVLLVLLGISITGGLHLDGAMDTADGLAVLDPERRLVVMADSRTGAFGVMAAAAILLLKIAALSDLSSQRWLALITTAGWGRWGQLVAIARYPYLKPTGKGAFHKAAIRSLWEVLPSLLLLMGLCGVQISLDWNWKAGIATGMGGMTIALLTGAYFNHRLGGHTGDTYGAVVEWTEALLLCWMTILY